MIEVGTILYRHYQVCQRTGYCHTSLSPCFMVDFATEDVIGKVSGMRADVSRASVINHGESFIHDAIGFVWLRWRND